MYPHFSSATVIDTHSYSYIAYRPKLQLVGALPHEIQMFDDREALNMAWSESFLLWTSQMTERGWPVGMSG